VPIGDRIKDLISSLGMSAKRFSETLEVSDRTFFNYTSKGTIPGSDFIEKIALTYSKVNIVWLITGQGEPFPPGGPEHRSVFYISDLEHERDNYKMQLELANKEIEHINDKLDLKDHIIYAKDETIAALRGSTKRPY
jgi:transcriptional regulator with XRE-family HTH domain